MHRRHRTRGGIIPAYAGSTSTPAPPTASPRDHPRIRGEHDPSSGMSLQQMGSSPHTRGAHRHRPARRHRSRIIPAYAGSTLPCLVFVGCLSDHPRIRGEHIKRNFPWLTRGGSSPHTRGALHTRAGHRLVSRIIPAYAGSTGLCNLGPEARPDHPRIRGEHIGLAVKSGDREGSSPHTRGAQIWNSTPSGPSRIIPAYAGSTLNLRFPAIARIGSSPHTRGAHPHGAAHERRPRIIPAYAGSTACATSVRRHNPDHPRIRGEHDSITSSAISAFGSSPHTRGAHALHRGDALLFRIIPAYAGSTRRMSWTGFQGRDHPRIRGEHTLTGGAPSAPTGSSPHTRGAQ